jgi:hypothetical protein
MKACRAWQAPTEMRVRIIMALDDIDSSDAVCWDKPRCTLHFSPVPVRAVSAASDEMSANLVQKSMTAR